MEKPINCFPGYEYVWSDKDKSYHNMFRGVDLGKGGWVYSEPGIYTNVALLDAASLHPASIINLNKLGKYTQRYADLRRARVFIKHGDYESASKLFDGKLAKYLSDKSGADALSAALKLPLNSFFGVSFASFENPARDSRDTNNIIALRGALFMKTLFDEVVSKGYQICHVKTDSIKIVNADIDIIKYVQEFSQQYGYEMEHETTYDRMCLIDKAQYVAAYISPEECQKRYGYIPSGTVKHFKKHSYPWSTTGDAFQNPYIFKTLFSGEPIEFSDLCETKSVKTSIYLDMNEDLVNVYDFDEEIKRRNYNLTHPNEPKKLKFAEITDDELQELVADGHDYHFVGRVGNFVPIAPGNGGGVLLRSKDGKFDAVTGSKGYRWLEAEKVKLLGLEDKYDRNYFDNMINEAIKQISAFGSFERFIDLSKPYDYEPPISPAADDDPPWSVVPCGDGKYNTCMDCPCCKGDICTRGYSLASYIEEGSGKLGN